MKILLIGGTGHIGGFLTPMLAEAGHDVTIVTTGRTSIPDSGSWKNVRAIKAVYARNDPAWPDIIARIKAETIIDILGSDLPALYQTVKTTCRHLIVCGSLWMWGEPKVAPTPEIVQAPCLFEGYRRRLQELLRVRESAHTDGVAFTALMPPNICGPGKIPLETSGGRDINVHRELSRGQPVILPAPGSTLIGPCDAEDVARGFYLAAEKRESAAGEIFNVGSAYAVTTQKFVEIYAEIYGRPIGIAWTDWQTYHTKIVPETGAHYHFQADMCPDIRKISAKLGYRPRYTPAQTLQRAVDWIRREKLL